MDDSRFPKTVRLLKSAEFDRVFQRRRSQGDGVLLVYGCESEVGITRLGLVVSRKCGNAVVRNRWKRTIREAFRINRGELPTGIDLVVLPRGGVTPTMARVRQSLLVLARQVARRLRRSDDRLPAEGESQ